MKFLVIRFSSLGDIIITTAFLKALKESYPKSKIYYATKEAFAEILEGQPYLYKVISLKKKESIFHFAKNINEKFDCVFDLHKNLRSTLLSLFVKTKEIKRVNKYTLYRYKLLHGKLLFFIRNRRSFYNIEDQLELIPNAKKDTKPVLFVEKQHLENKKNIIGIAPGAKWKIKRWPKEYFRELIGIIQKNTNYTVHIFGSKDEADIANYIQKGYKNCVSFAGELSIKETAEHMSNCSVVVSNDSALMHMATALDVPVVALFGPTVKGFGFYPKGRGIVLEKKLSCRPCSLHGSNKCKKNNHKCMKDIKPEEVFNAVKTLMEEEYE